MLSAIITLSGIGLIASLLLGIAAKKFSVEVDPKVQEIENVLVGANCGACGYAGCSALAKAIVEGNASVTSCLPGGPDVAEKIGSIMGVKAQMQEKLIAKIFCQGGRNESKIKFNYIGVSECRAASMLAMGNKQCVFGCLGYGSCINVCPFDAISMGPDGIPRISEEKCKACGKCIEVCPHSVIRLIPTKSHVHVLCNSLDKAGEVKKSCTVGCIGCGLCKKVCPENAINVENFLAKIDYARCTECLKCVEKCPRKIIKSSSQSLVHSSPNNGNTFTSKCVHN
ncbi:MAG: RnfABCDGE type electron transport complex subunit B [bacterium]